MKKKVTLDPPRSKSLWPEKPLTKDSPTNEIIARIPDYIERAREAFGCIESRCDSARRKGASVKLDNIARQIRVLMPTLEEWRKEVEAIIAEKPESGLF